MGSFISLILVLLLLGGCAEQELSPKQQNKIAGAESATNNIKKFQKLQSTRERKIPPMILPSVYEDVSVFEGQTITLSAENANLHRVLYSISKIAGLNLIIDKDVSKNIPITLVVEDANLEDVLDIVMKMSGCYYELKGNILHVKEFMRKRFVVAYVHSNSSFSTQLGGDTLSSAMYGSGSGSGGGSSAGGGGTSSGSGGSSGGTSSRGITGRYSLQYDTPKDANDFYKHLEANLKSLISDEGKYTLNRFSGVLSVYDKKKNVDAIANLIKDLKKQFNRQILIEAKVLEVSLNDGHKLGVNWDAVGRSVLSAGDTLNIQQTLGLGGAVAGTVNYSSDNLNAVINALDENGKVDTLSNPRIKVLNGQSAIISSGKLVPYWEKQVDTSQGTSTSNVQVTYNRRDVLDGITMGVTPVVMQNGRIMLNITPISSSIESEKSYYDENGLSVATAPVVNIKEAGTIIYAKDNDLVLIGGLINNVTKQSKEKVPFFGDIPIMGSMFSRVINTQEKKELVILLRLKVIE